MTVVCLYANYTSHVCMMCLHVWVCSSQCVRTLEWSLGLSCSNADTGADGMCSCVILSLWPCYEWRPLGAGRRERQTDPQLMVVLMLLIRAVSGKLKFSPGPKVDTGFLPADKRVTAKPLWQHLLPWHWMGATHTYSIRALTVHTDNASIKSIK